MNRQSRIVEVMVLGLADFDMYSPTVSLDSDFPALCGNSHCGRHDSFLQIATSKY